MGDSYKLSQTPLDQPKISKVKHYLEGSRHPNFMNPFECGKSFLENLFPKIFGILTQSIGGADMPPVGL